MKKEESCKSCKKGISNVQLGMLILSFYILGSSIYGTVKIVQYIISLF